MVLYVVPAYFNLMLAVPDSDLPPLIPLPSCSTSIVQSPKLNR